MRAALRFSLLVFAGLVLLQAAWIVTMPPFRGSDEFDHVFRAVGVAEGQWRPTVDTAEGRGVLVAVPRDVVDAASPQCDARPYTGPHNCFPVETLSNGLVTVSTAAGAYNPAYYFVIGNAGQHFEGAGVDYAMRAVSALMSALGVACAAFCLVLAGGGAWTRFGLLTAMTPVLVYTSTLPAPNAMEIVAGICLWTSLFGFLRVECPPRHARGYLLVATTAACVLATVRYIGPLWLGLIILASLGWAGWTNTKVAILRDRWPLLLCTVVVLAALAAGAWWTLSADLVGPTEDRAEYGGTVDEGLGLQPLVWVLQIIAAFPLRADVAPATVYAAYLIVVLALVCVGFARATGRARLVLVGICLTILALPIALTLATMEAHGIIWQGRYGLPLAVGLTIICGRAMDRAGVAPREGGRLRVVGCLVLATAHAMGIARVLSNEHADPVSVADAAWLGPHVTVVLLLIVGGWALWALSLGEHKTVSVGSRSDDATRSLPDHTVGRALD